MRPEPEFRPRDILAILERHDVEYVIVGGLAASLHGSPHVTTDIDITPKPEPTNLERLSAALKELNAKIRFDKEPFAVPFDHDAAALTRANVWNLTTDHGDLDICFVPVGTEGYEDLHRDAEHVSLDSITVQVASLADVVRSKEAAGRPKDRIVLFTLRRLLEEQG